MNRISAEQRREDFVNAAVRTVAANGASGATTRLIAVEADAPLASLHYCYESKEALFDAVFEALARRPYEWAESEQGLGLAVAASNVLTRAVDWYVEHPDWARARLELFFWAVHAEDGEVAARAYDLQGRALSDLLYQACAKRDDVTLVPHTTQLLIALVDGLLLQWLSREDEAALRDELKSAAEALEAMLKPARRASTRT
jgi:TetR/AcrR family transcriptional regulator, regulator of biofilm formation and stress response